MKRVYVIGSLLILLIFLMFQTVSSAEFGINGLGTVSQNECINLIQTCANCTYLNFTSVIAPNTTRLLENAEAEKSGTEYNYTFCDTASAGEYIVNSIGDIDGVDTIKSYTFLVSNLGITQTTSQAIGSAVFILIILALTVFFMILGINLAKSAYLWIMGIFFMFLSAILLVYDTWLLYQYHLLLTGLPASHTPEIIFYIFLMIVGAGLLSSLALLFTHWKKIFKYIKSEIKRKEDNYEDVEDWDYDEWKYKRSSGKSSFNPPNIK